MTEETVSQEQTAKENPKASSSGHPALWMLGFVLVYYALQAWILPAAGVQT